MSNKLKGRVDLIKPLGRHFLARILFRKISIRSFIRAVLITRLGPITAPPCPRPREKGRSLKLLILASQSLVSNCSCFFFPKYRMPVLHSAPPVAGKPCLRSSGVPKPRPLFPSGQHARNDERVRISRTPR